MNEGGEDYANFFENMLDNLTFIQQLAQSVLRVSLWTCGM